MPSTRSTTSTMPLNDGTAQLVATLVCVLLSACSGQVDRSTRNDQQARPAAAARLPAVTVDPDDRDLVRYVVRFTDRQNHYFDVEGVFPAAGDTVELIMPVWTPGSYLVREYSRNIETMSAATPAGEPLVITKHAKDLWQVASHGADHVVVRYRLYANELTVRSNFVASDLVVIVGAATFLTIDDDHVRPCDVTLELPADWQHSVTAMTGHPGGTPHRYLAPDYDTLIDSPIVAGNPALHDFAIDGVPHVLASFGEGSVWDGTRAAKDLATLVRAQVDFWKVIPYQRYVFLNVIATTFGSGLEHMASTLVTTDRWRTRKHKDYIEWLGLMSHEFFHTWNVKRLRPVELGPFDYQNEIYTRSLWIAEGFTSYYDDLLLRRAGLIDDNEYLEALSQNIEDVQKTPGRRMQSLSESSFDSWIKFYRPDENAVNSQISYYYKGALVGFLLDATIRRATQSQRSLDDVMRLAYQRYSGKRGYTPEEFRAVAAEVAGIPLDDFFARAVDGTGELDYQPALELMGLRFADDKSKSSDKGQKSKEEEEPSYLGVDTAGTAVVQSVERDTPAYRAGINVDDEILAIGEYRVPPGALGTRLAYYRPGEKISLLVARRGVLQRIEVTLGERPVANWKVALDPRASPAAIRQRTRWLTGT